MLYGRVSKLAEGETEGRSVDSQLAAGRKWAEQTGVVVVGVFRDDGMSAFDPKVKRSGWRAVMTALASGEANEVWAWEAPRASRDREVWSKLIRTCQANDALITFDSRTHDPNDADDGFMLDLMAALAVRESKVTSKRILRSVKERADRGQPHGKLPWAYRREYHPDTGRLLRQVPNEVTAPILRELARRVLSGESMYAVCNDLNARGVPSPESTRQRRLQGDDFPLIPWHASEIRDQLVSPTNAGLRAHKGVVVSEAAWPAVLTAEQYAALRAKLVHPVAKSWRDGGARHLLTGIAECGVCGGRMRRVKNRSYPSYSCQGLDKRGSSCVARLQEPLDAHVTVRVVARLQDPALVERLAELQGEADSSAGDAVRSVVELRARLRQFEEAATSVTGAMEVAAFARVVAELSEQIRAAESQVTGSGVVPKLVLDAAGPDAAARWDGLTVPQQRQVVRALFRVVVHRSVRRHGSRGFDDSVIEMVALL